LPESINDSQRLTDRYTLVAMSGPIAPLPLLLMMFTDAERRRLARKAYALGRKVLNELETVVTPDTLMRWYRNLIARKGSSQAPPPPRWDAQLLPSRGRLIPSGARLNF
jgi:hypothetical protein